MIARRNAASARYCSNLQVGRRVTHNSIRAERDPCLHVFFVSREHKPKTRSFPTGTKLWNSHSCIKTDGKKPPASSPLSCYGHRRTRYPQTRLTGGQNVGNPKNKKGVVYYGKRGVALTGVMSAALLAVPREKPNKPLGNGLLKALLIRDKENVGTYIFASSKSNCHQ